MLTNEIISILVLNCNQKKKSVENASLTIFSLLEEKKANKVLKHLVW